MQKKHRIWLARLLILPVLGWNLECAATFVLRPGWYAGSFEVSGVPGESLVRALGLLFLMWSVPYVVALTHPLKRRVALYEALAMQSIGLLGESLMLANLPAGHAALRSTTWRFIAFDGAGVVLLVVVVVLVATAEGKRGSIPDKMPKVG